MTKKLKTHQSLYDIRKFSAISLRCHHHILVSLSWDRPWNISSKQKRRIINQYICFLCVFVDDPRTHIKHPHFLNSIKNKILFLFLHGDEWALIGNMLQRKYIIKVCVAGERYADSGVRLLPHGAAHRRRRRPP